LVLALWTGSVPAVDRKNYLLVACLSVYSGLVGLFLLKIYTDCVLLLMGCYGILMLYTGRQRNTTGLVYAKKEN
jgi:hypothetical protein